ncbi:MAG TPA: hypothetical protein VJG90_07270 [Candidatus Nanoarchaeia archaeon]|nr:hypothetical protein [Candidatus Nanoarchaeia archaeon]
MSDVTISVRVDKQIHEQMKRYEEINWSAMLRQSIDRTLQDLEKIDKRKALSALKIAEYLRKEKAFSKGKSSVELIREWREKRR